MGKKNKYRKAALAAKVLPIVMKDSHENHFEKGWEMIARGQGLEAIKPTPKGILKVERKA